MSAGDRVLPPLVNHKNANKRAGGSLGKGRWFRRKESHVKGTESRGGDGKNPKGETELNIGGCKSPMDRTKGERARKKRK